LLRFQIAGAMVLVALAALDFWVIRVVAERSRPVFELLAMGVLPMANVLAVGLLIGKKLRGARPFLLGFAAFGVMASALYVALAVFSHQAVHTYQELLLQPIRETIGLDRTVLLIATIYPAAVGMVALPQLAFALMGGFLFQKYRITITKRPALLPVEK
jgi:hypothetical protein